MMSRDVSIFNSAAGWRRTCRERRMTCLLAIVALTFAMPLSALADDGDNRSITFNADIRPILADKCFACHGFDAKQRQADLRLDTADGAYADRDGEAAVTPHELAKSQLWQRITSDDPELRMPPEDSNKTLTPDEITLLKRWIEQGAVYQRHWAFEPPVRAAVPESDGELAGSGRNPIDSFIVQRLRQEQLTMSPEADRHTLIRRVAFALTGLPPTPHDVQQFVTDGAAGAYERMVDRYLESPHFGEEMARHWLDVARYADTHGMHLDNERQMWAYRDWVVRAFNRNQPFDEFTVDQLAGDQVAAPTQDQLIATGFNRCNVTTGEGGSIDAEYVFRYAVDRTSTTVQTWLGLTAGCAVCHDHKFDPITQREFYSLYAFFNSAADPAMDGNLLLTPPSIRLEDETHRRRLAELREEMRAVEGEMASVAATIVYHDPASASSPPPAKSIETIWIDDDFPSGGTVQVSSGHPTEWVTAENNVTVQRGKRALRRTDTGVSQDVWEGKEGRLLIPAQGSVFAHVWLDPANPPRSIMLQFFKNGWLHRAVWGDYEAIPWGAVNTTERVHMGPLPALGAWVRLEFPATQVGLAAGDVVTGFAVTQFAGTVIWDAIGVVGTDDPSADPQRSFLAWWRQAAGRDTPNLATELNDIAKAGPRDDVDAELRRRLLHHYFQTACAETLPQFAQHHERLAQLRNKVAEVENSIPSTFIYRDMDQPRTSYVMLRGAYDKPGEEVQPDVPAVLPRLATRPEGRRASRLEFAQWLVDEDNPLTARVAVNRFWQQMFGVGLVKTSYDFGTQGETPSHPELLDWLAVEFRESGWNVKDLLRMMVCSATFRQSSQVEPSLLARDPENRWYGRGPRLRLDAEQIRDNALFVSGLIDLTMGGKGVKPYQPANIWEPVGFAGSNTRFYQQDTGSALYRRSLYTFLKRTAPAPFMSNFDAPNREQYCARRERSNTPLQALQLMNDVQHVEAARAFAERMIREGGSTEQDRIRFAFQEILARNVESDEEHVLVDQLRRHLARYTDDAAAATSLVTMGESKPDATIPAATLAAYTLVANTILNLDETLTRN